MNMPFRNERAFKVVGTRPPRPDGIDKVTGRALYGADITAPGMLTGRILRSPHPHAEIVSIDTSAAEALTGVKAVVTSADFGVPEDLALRDIQDNCLARGKVLYEGHAVAALPIQRLNEDEVARNKRARRVTGKLLVREILHGVGTWIASKLKAPAASVGHFSEPGWMIM